MLCLLTGLILPSFCLPGSFNFISPNFSNLQRWNVNRSVYLCLECILFRPDMTLRRWLGVKHQWSIFLYMHLIHDCDCTCIYPCVYCTTVYLILYLMFDVVKLMKAPKRENCRKKSWKKKFCAQEFTYFPIKRCVSNWMHAYITVCSIILKVPVHCSIQPWWSSSCSPKGRFLMWKKRTWSRKWTKWDVSCFALCQQNTLLLTKGQIGNVPFSK